MPVVSTGMREVVAYAADGVVYIADDPETFSGRIREALAAAGDAGRIEERLGIAAANSWAARAEQIMAGIETGLNACRTAKHAS